jgi:uncharacterized membrane protein YgdD (TMEM256/DUF423 family)
MSSQVSLVAGSLLGALAVVLGAFGAHWLREAVTHWGLDPVEQSRRLEIWDVAVRYQMYHALALLAVGLLAGKGEMTWPFAIATWLFIVGVAVFSGLLYALVVSGVRILGAIVPIGGVALIAGWIALLTAVARRPGS